MSKISSLVFIKIPRSSQLSIMALYIVLFFTSCATSPQQKELDYVEKLCSNQPMVGDIKGAKVQIEAQRNKLESLKLSVGIERYSRLDQELQNYSAEWESLNQSTQLSCRDWAICQHRYSVSPVTCNEARDKMEDRQEAARKFLERMKQFEPKIEAPTEPVSITQAIPVSRMSKLSDNEFSLDITVRNPTPKVIQLNEVRLDFYGPHGAAIAAVTEVSNTYTVLIGSDGTTVVKPTPDSPDKYPAYAWFPAGCMDNEKPADRFIVKSPIWQTIKPNDVDRFIVKVVFPKDDCLEKSTFEQAQVEITFNNSEKMNYKGIKIAE